MRKISDKLLDRLKNGDLLPLLNYIKSDSDLRLEVRRNGDAFVYYRKGKALGIKKLEFDKKYGNAPINELAKSNPNEYFKLVKVSIDNWINNKKKRAEFDTQQNIAKFNQDKEDKYIIIDMEYGFEQNQIKEENRIKKGLFDLLGIDRNTGKIIFFELKKGLGATEGKSGIDGHIADFKKYCTGNNYTNYFKNNLINDIKNIIQDKIALEIINNYSIPENLSQHDPELVFVFHPEKESEIEEFSNKLKNKCRFVVVSDNSYKLK